MARCCKIKSYKGDDECIMANSPPSPLPPRPFTEHCWHFIAVDRARFKHCGSCWDSDGCTAVALSATTDLRVVGDSTNLGCHGDVASMVQGELSR